MTDNLFERLPPEQRDAALFDWAAFGNVAIKLNDDGSVTHVPLKDVQITNEELAAAVRGPMADAA